MEAEEERVSRRWLDLIGALIGALLLALLVQWVLVRPYAIPSASMEPTLTEGQRVFVDRLSDRFADPKRGQIVVFHPPAGAERPGPSDAECGVPRPAGRICPSATPREAKATYIKRVVGLPGDRVELRNGHVIRNGVPVPEPYARQCAAAICTLAPYTVPSGSYFLLGDNRGDSSDSRSWGSVPRRYVIGRAFATYWPPSRIGGL
ncbi:MAG: signal peptidase I [Solirubrobacteraceae bacterium]|nr:signal peptidase I [Patulibacter sp.]